MCLVILAARGQAGTFSHLLFQAGVSGRHNIKTKAFSGPVSVGITKIIKERMIILVVQSNLVWKQVASRGKIISCLKFQTILPKKQLFN